MRKDLQADGMLLLVALAWGASNYLISICLTEMGPLTLNMLRFSARLSPFSLLVKFSLPIIISAWRFSCPVLSFSKYPQRKNYNKKAFPI